METLGWLQISACCLAAFTGGFATATSGTGGLFTIPVYLLCGIPPFLVHGTNKTVLVFGVSLSAFRFKREGIVDWALFRKYLAPALIIPGAATFLAFQTNGELWSLLIAIIVLSAAALTFPVKKTSALSFRPPSWMRIFIFPLIWFYEGFAGPLAGALLFVAFSRVGKGAEKLGDRKIMGTTRWIQFVSVSASAGAAIFLNLVIWELVFYLSVFSALGNYVGAVWITKIKEEKIRPVLFGFCLLSAIGLLFKITAGF